MSIFDNISSSAKKALILSILSLTTISSHSQEKPASLVLKESFGSDPYNKMVYHDGTILVTGNGVSGDYDGSRNLDILQYSDSGLELLSQFQLPVSEEGLPFIGTRDATYSNGYWLILASSFPGDSILTASISDGKLTIIDELKVTIHNNGAQLLSATDNNVYLVTSDTSLEVTHFKVDDNGNIEQKSETSFGITPNNPVLDDNFSASYDNQALYLTSNQGEAPAGLYKLPLATDGSPQEAVTLTLEGAGATYHTSKVVGDLWLLSYYSWGFQVVEIVEDQLNLVFESEDVRQYSDFEVQDNFIYALDKFGEIDIFEVSENNTITHVNNASARVFINDAHLVDDKLFFTQDSNGISVVTIENNTSLTYEDGFNQSSEIIDMATNENELALASRGSDLVFWQLNEETPASLTAIYEVTNGVQGVAWNDDEIIINKSAQLESHLAANLKNNLDVGTVHASLGSSGGNGRIIKLENGYLAQAFQRLNFINESKQLVSNIELDLDNNRLIQKITTAGNLVFVPLAVSTGIIIYDTSDLSNVTELSRIQLDGVRGNVAVKDNYLYVPVEIDRIGTLGITTYDISNPSEPVELASFRVGDSRRTASLHIDGDFLVIAGYDKGSLFDISNPIEPELIDENFNISTNSSAFSSGSGKDLFTISRDTAGLLLHNQINLAPEHTDLTISLQEDEQTTAELSASDNENDSVTFSILNEPEKGTLLIQDNATLTYSGASNANGADSAKLLVTDIHGGASEFNLAINITPVNDAPELETSEIEAFEDTTATVSLLASDADGDTLTFDMLTAANFGNAEVSSEGVVTYTAAPNYNGEDNIEVQVTDNAGLTDTKVIAINIHPVNDIPVFTAETRLQESEDNTLSFELSADDIDGDSVTFELLSVPSGWGGELNGSVLSLIPKANDNGDFSVSIAMNDGQTSTTQTLQISLAPVNDAPTFDNSSVTIAVTSGQSQTARLSVTDVDGDNLTFTVSEQPSKGTVTVSAEGVVTYRANEGTTGSDSFSVTVSDTAGATATKSASVNISAPASSDSGGSGGSLNWLYLLGLLILTTKRRFKF